MFTTSSFKSAVLSLAIFGGMSIGFAQEPQQQPQQQQQQQQQQPPQQAQQGQDQGQDVDVDDDELEQFANVFQDVQKINQDAQDKMIKKIEDQGLDVERYQELRSADSNPDSDVDASDEELEKKEKIDDAIEDMEPKLQKEQTDIIEKSDMDMDRYQEIAMALRSDQDLQQKFQSILMEQQDDEQ